MVHVTLYSKETSVSRISVGSHLGGRPRAMAHALAAGLSLEDQINQPHGMSFGVLLRSMDSARAVSRESAVDNLSTETTGFYNL
jgi:hypothetical protein